jgi:hypothetical protein
LPPIILGLEQPPQSASTLWPGGPWPQLVVADFRMAVESGENVLAPLMSGTFGGDFGGDFGPYLGGGAPFEYGPTARGGGAAPCELLQTQRGGSARIESTALFGWDATLPLEAVARVFASLAGPSIWSGDFVAAEFGPWIGGAGLCEWLLVARADPPVRVETAAGRASDMPAVAEALRTARADPPAQAELLLTAPGSGLGPAKAGIEAASGAAGDLSVPAELRLTGRADASVPLEALLWAKSDNAPLEWAAILRTDMLAPGEAVLTLAFAGARAAPIETVAVYRADLTPLAEWQGLVLRRFDSSLPVEILLSAVRSGAYVELGSILRLDPPAPSEAGETVRPDPAVPAEAASSAARADLTAPVEELLAVALVAGPGPAGGQAEWLAMVRALVVANNQAPVEWAGIIRADAVPGIELAALSSSDLTAVLEWFRTLVGGGRAPAEWASTAPAPILFVSGGRLR